jgi:hypothetical protein
LKTKKWTSKMGLFIKKTAGYIGARTLNNMKGFEGSN